jgi:ribonuclease T2
MMRIVVYAAIAVAIVIAVVLWQIDGGAPPTAPVPTSIPVPSADQPPPRSARAASPLVLAASWQPAFCEGQPNRTECRSQTASRFDATNFALHGLWPQPDYCDVGERDREADLDSRWSSLPAVSLPVTLRGDLDRVMPGTASNLERHEWIKHGTCYGADMVEYWSDALAVMSALNASAVRTLFAANIGRRLTQAQIRAAFDTAFGAGAGQRVRVACQDDGNRRIITEITIGLVGQITGPADFATLILASRPTDGGCDSGIVDAAGLQ